MPSREILWNVHTFVNQFVMYALLAVSAAIGAYGVFSRARLWAAGKPSAEHLGLPVLRFLDLYALGLFQEKTNKEPFPGLAHALVYSGFLVLLFATTMVFIDNDLGFRVYQGGFYLAITFLSDLFGLAMLFGCAMFAHRRYIEQADLIHNRAADALALILLALLVVQGFLLEGLRIHATSDPWALYSPVGWLTAQFLWPLSQSASRHAHFVIWWFHTLTVFAVIAAAPYTKFFHILASSANLYFMRGRRQKGAMKYPGDIQEMMERQDEFSLGLNDIRDYTWKQRLDLDACTSCGRCQDNCPAYMAGTPLSPKWLILDSRNHLLGLHAQGKHSGTNGGRSPLRKLDRRLTRFFLHSSGLSYNSAEDRYLPADRIARAGNARVQQSVLSVGGAEDDSIAGRVMDPAVFWSCTTCMACVEACPVGIDHLDQIIGNRRNLTLIRGELPSDAQKMLRSTEMRSNPYGSQEERLNWCKDLNVRVLQPGDEVEYLYWVGCVSAFDPRKQRIARAMVKLMQAAGVSFGILGKRECCTGDPARRLGEENLFQSLAKTNLEVLRSVKFSAIVANCPHCFNSLRNEYPQVGSLGADETPVIHHSMLLKQLLEEGRLNIKGNAASTYTFHDPCYLGRYNDEYEAPRGTIRKVPGLKILEMDRSRAKGMCCGAGGGHFWMDLKKGDKRVNAIRAEQAAATGANRIATACPFCMQMLEDGVKMTGSDAMEVKDIAEILAEQVEGGA